MTLEQKLRRTGELMHQWCDAERLCNALCHALEWTNDGDEVRRLDRMLQRARARSVRRYDRYRNWFTHEA